ncbi:gamma carbonic anhydrase family protein [Roseicella aquatilis]|uniref:Gamma carbonic anhydrase family protein n=1 Tax=Roseicella aquatilis TaxID=2527868 RepID=A0A4R4DSD1_9PROT|nr:gamma carbonic anhydrase family protein [Roseicella aquatilis]TCZ65504.1 gamma carbonic anhydrase family protein [Roseicella aquatilis]
MILEHDGQRPRIAAGVRIAPTAIVCGDVEIGPGTSIGFGCVVVAESGPVRIGADCVVMDTAVLRGTRRHPLAVGDRVLIGPRACLVGCTVEEEAFLATGATVFNGARIGRRAEVRINGVVHLRTTLPADATVPIGWVAVGDPAEILPPEAHERIWAIQEPLDFPRTVFGLDRPTEGESIMPQVMPRYAALLRRHLADRPVPEDQSEGGTA